MPLLYSLSFINAQIALPTFQGVHSVNNDGSGSNCSICDDDLVLFYDFEKGSGIVRDKGISVLSYFIGGDYSYDSDNKSFKNMYGSDASFINATNMMDVAKTMNQKFLEK